MDEMSVAEILQVIINQLTRIKKENFGEKPLFDVQQIKPFLKRGWLAMNKNGEWYLHKSKPTLRVAIWQSDDSFWLGALNIKPVPDWIKSLTEV